MIYAILVCHVSGREYVVFAREPGLTNMSLEPRVEGWLGSTNGTNRTALGAFRSEALARKAARGALGYGPREGRTYREDAPGYPVGVPRFY